MRGSSRRASGFAKLFAWSRGTGPPCTRRRGLSLHDAADAAPATRRVCQSVVPRRSAVDWKLELVVVPVSDVDRAKAFYAEQLGFAVDVDHRPSESFRVVQLTPPGSACSITIGTGLTPT